MPTSFFMRNLTSSVGGAGGRLASQMRGTPNLQMFTTTTAGGTNIQVTETLGGTALEWFTEPITAAVTISGTVTVNIRGLESATTVNAGAGVLIERCDNAGTVLSAIVPDSTFGLEWGTTDTARTGNLAPTSTSMAVGERIKVTWKVRNVGTMGAGTVTNGYNGPGTAGETFVRFTEDIRTDEIIEVQPLQGGGRYGYN